MRRFLYFRFAFLVLGCVALFSCKKDDPTTTTEPNTPDTPNVENVVIETSVILDDVWNEYLKSKDGSNPKFVCYLFDPNDSCLRASGKDMSVNMKVIFDEATIAGEHKIYAITGWYGNEIPLPSRTTIDLNTNLPLLSNRNISLGCTTFTTVTDSMDYSVQVTTDYIMAILDLDIKYVPSYITAITVQLPNQGNTFKFDGTINGNTQVETLQLTKSTTPNENESYDWSIAGAVVLPSATGTQAMPINVIYTTESGTTETISTSTTVCCLSGSHKSLWAEWNAFYAAATVIVNPWTTDVETGEFDL